MSRGAKGKGRHIHQLRCNPTFPSSGLIENGLMLASLCRAIQPDPASPLLLRRPGTL
jgi:hypothetical protein